MGNKAQPNKDRSRTTWTPSMDRYFIELMVDQVHKGNKIDQGFNRQAWIHMIGLFNNKFGVQFDKDILKNRHKTMKKTYNNIKHILDQSGFEWDEQRQMVTADDLVWDDYIKAHPEASKYRTKSILNFNDLSMIYGNTTADGRLSRSGHDVFLGDDILGAEIVVASGGQGSPTRNRTTWTPPMDRYFIELMVDQVHGGNKIDQGFNKQAWIHMINLFNNRFGVKFDKDILKNRHKTMKKTYNNIKLLLDQSGFSWDKQRQVVTADDHVWDDYIKGHPEASKYRTRSISNFNDISAIFGNTTVDGKIGPSGHDVFPEDDILGVDAALASGGQASPARSVGQGFPIDDVPDETSETSGTKRRSPMPSTSQRSRKPMRRRDGESIVDAINEMAAAITNLVNKKKEVVKENWMDALVVLPDIDEDLFLDACDLLEDERKAKTFVALDVVLRRKWLLKKLRPSLP